MKDLIGNLSSSAKGGAIAVALGFVVTLSFGTTESFNGVVTSCTYFDLAPLIFGTIALVLGLKCFGHGRRHDLHRTLDYSSGAALLVLGVLHLVRAFGVVGGAC